MVILNPVESQDASKSSFAENNIQATLTLLGINEKTRIGKFDFKFKNSDAVGIKMNKH